MKSVILSGYYGYGNLGDELILKYVANLLKELGYEKIIALTGNTEYSKRKHKEIEFINRNDISQIQELVKHCSCTALAGGGLFQEFNKLSCDEFFKQPLNGVHSYINLPIISRIYKKPCYYLFQGVGPFFSDEGRYFARYAYSLADLILTRDINSSKLLSDMGIKEHIISADPVFLQMRMKKKEFNSKPKIAICLRQWIEKDFEKRMIEAFISFINHFFKDYEFTFISFQDTLQEDLTIYENINMELSTNIQVPVIKTNDLSLEEAEELISNYDFIIGMRYHSILLAIKYNIPFVAINYWDKVRNIVEEVGLNEFIIEKQDLTCASLKKIFEKLVNKFEQIKIKIEYESSRLFNRLQPSIEMLKDKINNNSYYSSFAKTVKTRNEVYLDNWIRYKKYQENVRSELDFSFFSKETIRRLLRDSESNKVLIYPSLITWDTTFFQRPHQILREFAKRDYKVFFITPNPTHDKAFPINQVENNIFIINSVNLLIPLKDEPIKILVTWTMNIVYKELFPNALIIYDWLDHLEVFKEYYCPFMEIDHLKLIKSADIVTATSDALLKEVRTIREDALLVPNGVRIEDFISENKDFVPDDLVEIKKLNKPIVGYYGLFALWRFDYNLVNYITTHMKDVNFVFIGLSDDGSQSMFQQGENLFILPPKKYSELKYYMQHFDAGIIPYKTDRIAETIFPNKLCEFLAMGIPVVTSNLPECKKFKSVLVASTYDDFVNKLCDAIKLNKDNEYKETILNEASQNTWQNRVNKIIDALNKITPKNYYEDNDLLLQECNALNLTIDILLSKNSAIFEDYKTAIRERDNTWLQLNRVIDEKDYLSFLNHQKETDLDRTKSDLDRTK
ncbi:MAG: polysaccharide pyruvyl transferase family protein, partial [Thermodesulfovibrionales bacterium]|nr:polysaccharide pyruvyl transferase family protein [Thermodesulfovibrionales bacterium]